MKDFVKIFVLLVVIVAAFVYGRQYGQDDFKQSEEYLKFIKAKDEQTFTKSEIENAKIKFQNIIDHASSKKADEILTQILQVLRGDLGVQTFDEVIAPQRAAIFSAPARTTIENREMIEKTIKPYDYKKLKSYEWILENSRDTAEVRSNLKNVEITSIDRFLKDAKPVTADEARAMTGSYRGRILDISQNEYGTLSFQLALIDQDLIPKIKGEVKIFKNGKETALKNFSGNQLGFRVDGLAGFVIENENTYYQIYKIPNSQQLVGYYYERLVRGTTKTIGTFVLNRVDQF